MDITSKYIVSTNIFNEYLRFPNVDLHITDQYPRSNSQAEDEQWKYLEHPQHLTYSKAIKLDPNANDEFNNASLHFGNHSTDSYSASFNNPQKAFEQSLPEFGQSMLLEGMPFLGVSRNAWSNPKDLIHFSSNESIIDEFFFDFSREVGIRYDILEILFYGVDFRGDENSTDVYLQRISVETTLTSSNFEDETVTIYDPTIVSTSIDTLEQIVMDLEISFFAITEDLFRNDGSMGVDANGKTCECLPETSLWDRWIMFSG